LRRACSLVRSGRLRHKRFLRPGEQRRHRRQRQRCKPFPSQSAFSGPEKAAPRPPMRECTLSRPAPRGRFTAKPLKSPKNAHTRPERNSGKPALGHSSERQLQSAAPDQGAIPDLGSGVPPSHHPGGPGRNPNGLERVKRAVSGIEIF
jgi:hypothetical protein